MTCPLQSQENAEVLLDYCARRLGPGASVELERHIELCVECRRFADGQRLVWESLDAWDATPITTDFDRRLYRKIEARESTAWWTRTWEPLRASLRPAAALASVFVAVAVITMINQPSPSLAVSNAARAAEAVEIDQVEKALEDMEMLQQLEVLARQQLSGGEEALPRTL